MLKCLMGKTGGGNLGKGAGEEGEREKRGVGIGERKMGITMIKGWKRGGMEVNGEYNGYEGERFEVRGKGD